MNPLVWMHKVLLLLFRHMIFLLMSLISIWQLRVSVVLTNSPYMLNLDCDYYVKNNKNIREAMCFMTDPMLGNTFCYVHFPHRFDGIERNDWYANRNIVFFDVSANLYNQWLHIYFTFNLSSLFNIE